jgi:hypothetical protein
VRSLRHPSASTTKRMYIKYLLLLILADFIVSEVVSASLPLDQQTITITQTFTSTTTCQSDIQQSTLGNSVSANDSSPLTTTYQSNTLIPTSAPLVTLQPASAPNSTSTLSTLPTSTSTSSRDCLLQIWESVLYNLVSIQVHLNVTVPGNSSTYKEFEIDFGQNATIAPVPLSYDVCVFFTTSMPTSKYFKERQLAPRFVWPPPATISPWKEWVVNIRANSSQWTSLDEDPSVLPFCQVGPWEGERIWVSNSFRKK